MKAAEKNPLVSRRTQSRQAPNFLPAPRGRKPGEKLRRSSLLLLAAEAAAHPASALVVTSCTAALPARIDALAAARAGLLPLAYAESSAARQSQGPRPPTETCSEHDVSENKGGRGAPGALALLRCQSSSSRFSLSTSAAASAACGWRTKTYTQGQKAPFAAGCLFSSSWRTTKCADADERDARDSASASAPG